MVIVPDAEHPQNRYSDSQRTENPVGAPTPVSVDRVTVRVRGKPTWVASARIAGRRVISTGGLLKCARVMDEELLEGDTLSDPQSFMSELRHSPLKTDIFTFAQRLPDVTPRLDYRREWDSMAVIPITTYSDWWKNRAEYDVRKAVKRASRLGVIVRLAEFNDAFVHGICQIYDETPVRQGKAFWHYQKSFEEVKQETGTYLERSTFIGAYHNDQLIGFVKMVRVGAIQATLHVISQKQHFDKKPTNALIAKAVELCEVNGASHLVYGTYDPKTSLSEFKRRNGFEQVLVPRYYVPLTLTGRIALRCQLHHEVTEWLPEGVLTHLRKARGRWYERKV